MWHWKTLIHLTQLLCCPCRFQLPPSLLPEDVELWVKRDDLSGMQLSGNKVRSDFENGNTNNFERSLCFPLPPPPPPPLSALFLLHPPPPASSCGVQWDGGPPGVGVSE